MTQPVRKIAILGAGLSGLSCAWHLSKQNNIPVDITVYEASDHVGGVVESINVGGSIFEWGPHTLRIPKNYSHSFQALLHELSLNQELIEVPKNLDRYLLIDSKLHPLPKSPRSLLKPYYLKNLVWPLLVDPFKTKSLKDEHSIEEYFTQRFGSCFFQNFIDPMVTGIWGGDPQKLSFEACFPHLENLKSRSFFLKEFLKKQKDNPSKIITLKNGLQSIPLAMAEKGKFKIHLNTPIKSLDLSNDKPVVGLNDSLVEYDSILCSLPANALKNIYPLAQPLLDSFNSISYKIIHLGFALENQYPKGFGALAPSWSQEPINGILFTSNFLPFNPSSDLQSTLTLFISERSNYFKLHDHALKEAILKKVEGLIGLKNPLYYNCKQVFCGVAQYELGHAKRCRELASFFASQRASFYFFGKSFTGGSAVNCLQQGEEIALKWINDQLAATGSKLEAL